MKDDGGPAFPVSTGSPEIGHQDGHSTWQYPGMTMRDFFAAKAMQALVSQPFDHLTDRELAQIPYTSYEIADAMLAARDKL